MLAAREQLNLEDWMVAGEGVLRQRDVDELAPLLEEHAALLDPLVIRVLHCKGKREGGLDRKAEKFLVGSSDLGGVGRTSEHPGSPRVGGGRHVLGGNGASDAEKVDEDVARTLCLIDRLLEHFAVENATVGRAVGEDVDEHARRALIRRHRGLMLLENIDRAHDRVADARAVENTIDIARSLEQLSTSVIELH